MSGHSEESREECVYCGSTENITKDHIPPKCLFAKPLPQDLITVPSCRKCNNSASKDDEHFRNVLSASQEAGHHPDAKEVANKFVRSLQRPKAQGLKRSFLNTTNFFYYANELDIIEPGGSYFVKLDRLERVGARIIKGLFWHHNDERLPNDCIMRVWVDKGLHSVDKRQMLLFFQVMNEHPFSAGKRAFKYWYKPIPEDQSTGIWVLQFYDNIHFYCLTINPKHNPTEYQRLTP